MLGGGSYFFKLKQFSIATRAAHQFKKTDTDK